MKICRIYSPTFRHNICTDMFSKISHGGFEIFVYDRNLMFAMQISLLLWSFEGTRFVEMKKIETFFKHFHLLSK